ncbi:hypothetical protein JCM15519_03730 [Fundidesulfovibrio butyratiphilus]
MNQVAVLFARPDSIYKTLTGCDVYDINRDARTWPGGCPVVAHPPCRAWGRLRHFAKPRDGEKDLALWAVKMVRKWGGVLEHPATSTLWKVAGLPLPDAGADSFGGWTKPICQFWFGHRAEKKTWLYIVGVEPQSIPPYPVILGEPTHVVQSNKRIGSRPHVTRAEREHTPMQLAIWLAGVAIKSKTPGQAEAS